MQVKASATGTLAEDLSAMSVLDERKSPLSLSRHESIMAARASLAASLDTIRQAAANNRPTVSLSGSYERENVSETQDFNGKNQFQFGARVDQNIYDFGQRRAGIDAATAQSIASRADLTATQRDIAIAARRALVDWQVTEERLAIGGADDAT